MLDRFLAQYAAEREEDQRGERRKTKLEVWGLGILAVYTAVTAGILHKEVAANRIAIDDAVAQTRAWLCVERVSVKVVPGRAKNPKVLAFDIEAHVVNMGQSPALGTRVALLVFAAFGPDAARRRTCDPMRH